MMKLRTFCVGVVAMTVPMLSFAQDAGGADAGAGGGTGAGGGAGGGTGRGSGNNAAAENGEGATKARAGYWTANLPGGTYCVALNKVTSVSIHSYFMEGGLQVQEVNIDTEGSAFVRFYYIAPPKTGVSVVEGGVARAQELVAKANEHTGTPDVQAIVTKQYPVTTHARTIEYRVRTDAEINELFANAMRAWQTGRASTFSIK